MKATEFLRWMDTGTTRPFLAKCDDGRLWVVKAHRENRESKLLFNELVSGRLAQSLALPWPEVATIEIGSECLDVLTASGMRVQSSVGVGTAFVPDLHPVDWPPGGLQPRDSFEQRNRDHIERVIPARDHRQALYGKNVFDNWVKMRDTKYDTLYLDVPGTPLFLDGGWAFGGDEWDVPFGPWDLPEIGIQSPYLEGVLQVPAEHRPWLERLEALSPEQIGLQFTNLPPEWQVPQAWLENTAALMRATADQFLPLFTQWVDYEELLSGSA